MLPPALPMTLQHPLPLPSHLPPILLGPFPAPLTCQINSITHGACSLRSLVLSLLLRSARIRSLTLTLPLLPKQQCHSCSAPWASTTASSSGATDEPLSGAQQRLAEVERELDELQKAEAAVLRAK